MQVKSGCECGQFWILTSYLKIKIVCSSSLVLKSEHVKTVVQWNIIDVMIGKKNMK
jgi:hypothetical protein